MGRWKPYMRTHRVLTIRIKLDRHVTAARGVAAAWVSQPCRLREGQAWICCGMVAMAWHGMGEGGGHPPQ